MFVPFTDKLSNYCPTISVVSLYARDYVAWIETVVVHFTDELSNLCHIISGKFVLLFIHPRLRCVD